MQNNYDGMCWDESDDEPIPFYGESIADALEKEGYQMYSGPCSSSTWGFIFDVKFLDTLRFIHGLPEVKDDGKIR